MPAPQRAQYSLAGASPELIEKAYHPFDKLVLGLPPAMLRWSQAYGPALEWVALPPNPLIPGSTRMGDTANRPSAAEASSVSAKDGRPREVEAGRPLSIATQPTSDASARAFRCDACDRNFALEVKYEEHMKTHIYCTVPGCNFTCREGRAHLMQEHMDYLHNRPDAPNLADTGAYLDQRKRRFPTQEVIKDKVEELYYKAARGVVLPDERRRWMKQYGIDVGKRARSDASFIARGSLPEGSRSPSVQSHVSDDASHAPAQPQRREAPPAPASSPAAEKAVEPERPRFIQPPTQLDDPTAPPHHSAASEVPPTVPPPSTSAVKPAAAPAPIHHPVKIIPLGPNGTLTPRQRVQLVRERYATAKEVPQFYVCHRCGKKGEHWVDDCPTKGDATYNRHVVWGEAKLATGEGKQRGSQRERGDRKRTGPHDEEDATAAEKDEEAQPSLREEAPEQDEAQQSAVPPASSSASASERLSSEAAPATVPDRSPADTQTNATKDGDEEDDAPPIPQSAASPVGEPKEVTRVMAPVAAARYAQPHRRDPYRRPPPPPTLYERLTEEERLNEQGLLLQAMRFFAARDFFQDKK